MPRTLSSAVLILGGILALAATPALAQDASPESSGQPTPVLLEGTVWQVTNARLSGAYAPIPAEVTATLVLQDGKAGGEGGCNQWSAPYTLDGDSLTFGQITSTLMFCDGPGGTIETFYLADLPAVATWAIDGTTLTLSADDGQPVVAYTVQEAPSLIGSWIVSSYRDATGNVVATEDGTTVVAFDATTLSGTAGCNGFSGSWSSTDGVLAIGPLMSTKMACEPAEVMARESAVIAALEASTGARSGRDGSVELVDASGALQLTLVPAITATATPAA
jgi:heat shock protein HslJ